MSRWLWIGGALLLGVAAVSVWYAFRSPGFVAGLTAIATAAAWKAIKPVVLSPETEDARAERVKAYRRGDGDSYFRRKSGAPPKG